MLNEAAADTSSPRKFYFMLTFWGEKFREHFYSLLLPTLLAPGNIPILKGWPGSKLIVCTTHDDWNALKDRSLMRELALYVEPLPIFIGYPGENAAIQLHMSRAHQMAARRAYEDRAIAGFLAPDLLCSDGLIETAVDFIENGKTAVACPALRFNMEAVLKRVTDAGFLKPDQVAALPAKFMGSVAANSLHPEILRYNFEGAEFDNYPIWSFWRVPERDGLILYTVSWALLLADYGAISRFTDEALNESTIDGNFVWTNFGHLRKTDKIALLNDSSQGSFISLTPEKEFDFEPYNVRARALNSTFQLLRLGTAKRAHDIHKFYHFPDIDPWRKWLYSVPIIIHGDATDARYKKCISRTQTVMELAFRGERNRRYLAAKAAIIFVKAAIVFVMDVKARALRWKYRIVHFARRGLHILSFGRIYYPGSSGRKLCAALLQLRIVHFTRRGLHIVSFGRIHYPGSSGRNFRAAGLAPEQGPPRQLQIGR